MKHWPVILDIQEYAYRCEFYVLGAMQNASGTDTYRLSWTKFQGSRISEDSESLRRKAAGMNVDSIFRWALKEGGMKASGSECGPVHVLSYMNQFFLQEDAVEESGSGGE